MPVVPATVSNKGHYEGYINAHNKLKPYKCNTCNNTFCYKSALLRHRKNCIVKIKKPDKHVCNICASSFNRVDILRDHINGKHEGNKPYRCQKCSISFAWRSSLSKHLQSKRHNNHTTSLLEQINVETERSRELPWTCHFFLLLVFLLFVFILC